MFNLLEIGINNQIRIRELTAEATADRPSQYHSSHTDSTDQGRGNCDGDLVHLGSEDELIQRVVAAFPLIVVEREGLPSEPVVELSDGYHKVCKLIRVLARDQSSISYQMESWTVKDKRVIAAQELPKVIVSDGDDLTSHPAKIQTIAAVLWV